MVNGRPVEPMGQPIKCHFEWIGHALTHYCGEPPRAAAFYSCEDGVYLKVANAELPTGCTETWLHSRAEYNLQTQGY